MTSAADGCRLPADSDGFWEYVCQQTAEDPYFDVAAARAEERYETHPPSS